MKTKILSLVTLILLVGFSSVFAGKPASESIYERFKSIPYPEQAVKHSIEGTVDVIFILNDDGEVVIKSISSSNSELKELVKKQLEEINCSGIQCRYNEHFKVRFDFKLI